jgi:ABC-type xylose transport system permease subunit
MSKIFKHRFEIMGNIIPANFLRQTGIFWAFLVLCIVMAFSQSAFLTVPNITNILKQISINGILAVGMTLVLISGGIDLSVGSIVAVSCVASAYFAGADNAYPIIIPFLVALAVGGFLGHKRGRDCLFRLCTVYNDPGYVNDGPGTGPAGYQRQANFQFDPAFH